MMPRRRRRGHAAFASDSERTEQHDFLDTSNLAADIQPNSLYAAPLLALSDPNCHSSWASRSRKHWNRTQHKSLYVFIWGANLNQTLMTSASSLRSYPTAYTHRHQNLGVMIAWEKQKQKQKQKKCGRHNSANARCKPSTGQDSPLCSWRLVLGNVRDTVEPLL